MPFALPLWPDCFVKRSGSGQRFQDFRRTSIISEPLLKIPEVFEGFRSTAEKLGVLRLIWFIPPPAHAVKHDKTMLLHWGFAPEWSSLYNSMPDEVPRNVEAATRAGRPIMWRDAIADIRAKRPGAKWPMLDEFVRLHPEEGFVFPVFGPFATEAVISCGVVPAISDFNDPRFLALAAAADEALRKIALIKHQEYRDAIRLSPREQAVLRGLGSGQSKKEIAREMDIAPSSVDTYARRIFFKLQVDDRVEAVVKAVSLGLVKL